MLKENPYTNRETINDPDSFYGRRLETSRIYSRVTAPNPQSVSIVGDKCTGKSSLLHFIYSEQNRKKYLDRPESYIFILMDLHEEPNATISDFIQSLLRLFEASEHEAESGLRLAHARTEYDALKRLAMELTRRRKKLIVLFDGFELVTQNEAFDSAFYAFLRGLASNYDIAFITSSMRDLQELCSVKEIASSPFFNIFSKVHLGPFRGDEAYELIRKPSSEAGYPLTEYTDIILEMSGMLPLFIQMACSAFFEYMLAGNRITGEGDVRKIEDIFFDEANAHFQYAWDEFGEYSRDVCKAIWVGKKIDEDYRNIVIDLTKRGYVIERNEEYRLFSSTFGKRIVAGYTS